MSPTRSTVEADRRGVALPRLADWLVEHPPVHEAKVHVSAWSCAHGVGRWLEDCGCHTGGEPGWNQAWRRPLRAAFDRVRDAAVEVFERRGPAVLHDPWAARDAYVDVLLGVATIERFAADHVRGDGEHLVDALTLLESQRHALLMYTSCGWFFNDLAGLETVQIMRYAACCCDLLAELGEEPPVEEVLAVLAEAQSNDPDEGDGRDVWRRHVGHEPRRPGACGRPPGHDRAAGRRGAIPARSPATTSPATCTTPSTGAGCRSAPAGWP